MINKDGEKVSTKPWNTKEWKKLRKKLIKDRCEQCGSTDKLILQHTWHPPNRFSLYRRVAYSMFKSWLSKTTQESIDKIVTDIKEEPNKLLSAGKLTKRETESLNKMLEKCNEKTPETPLFNWFMKDKNAEIYAEVLKADVENHKRYMTCKDTVTFCKKCAFLWDKKRQKLCPQCKVHYCNLEDSQCDVCSGKKKLCNKCNKNYHNIRYTTCFDCSDKRQEWKDAGKECEIEDYLSDVCDCDPECADIEYLYLDGRHGGSARKCNVEEACKKYPDVIRIKDEQKQ